MELLAVYSERTRHLAVRDARGALVAQTTLPETTFGPADGLTDLGYRPTEDARPWGWLTPGTLVQRCEPIPIALPEAPRHAAGLPIFLTAPQLVDVVTDTLAQLVPGCELGGTRQDVTTAVARVLAERGHIPAPLAAVS